MLEQAVRHHYQRWLVDPVAKIVPKQISPLHITLASGILGILIIPSMLYHQTSLAFLFLLLSGYLDTLDGTVARYISKTSVTGTVADIMTDRVVEFAILLALWAHDPLQRSLICLLMSGAILLCITSFLVAGIFTPNHSLKGFYYSPGIIERAEALIFFALMILLPDHFIFLGLTFIILTLLTTMIRLYEFRMNNYAY